MPFEKVVESLDAIDEDARVFYREGPDKKFHLVTAEDVTKLDGTLNRVRGELGTAKERAKAIDAWEKLGKSPEEIEQLLQSHADEETRKAMEKGEFDKIKQQIEANHAEELKKRDAGATKLRTALERHLIDSVATQALAEAKGSPTLLLPHIRDRVKVEEREDGEFHAVVLDVDRKTPKLNSKNEPMSISELVAAMREDEAFGRAFEGSGHSGGGGGPGGGGPGPIGAKKKAAMTPKEKAQFMREHGTAAYGQLE